MYQVCGFALLPNNTGTQWTERQVLIGKRVLLTSFSYLLHRGYGSTPSTPGSPYYVSSASFVPIDESEEEWSFDLEEIRSKRPDVVDESYRSQHYGVRW